MIENDLLDSKIVQYLDFPYFVHYIPEDELKRTIYDVRYYFSYDYDKFSANNWELHKKYIKEGHNPNEIAKIIRNDDIEKLQEISSQTNFDFNQYIEPSLYERCSFVNNSAALIYNSKNVTLIDYAAFFGSVKCFKYLLMNGSELENTGKYAIAGGNEEIIHLCEQNNSSFEGAYKAAIKFHKNDLFKYIYENKLEELYENYQNITFYNLNVCTLVELGKICILYDNYEIFSYLQDIGMKIDKFLINVTVKIGNLYLVKYLLKKMQIPKNILIFVVESKNIEIVKYVLDQEGIDINAKNIYLFYLISILIILYFKIIFGNYLKYFKQHLFWHLKMDIQK